MLVSKCQITLMPVFMCWNVQTVAEIIIPCISKFGENNSFFPFFFFFFFFVVMSRSDFVLTKFCMSVCKDVVTFITCIHTLRVHYAHAAANLNSGYSKYAKVARVHYFCTIALRTSLAVLTWAWASRRVDLRERRVDSFSKRVIIICW